jgi:nucleoprotein TPR
VELEKVKEQSLDLRTAAELNEAKFVAAQDSLKSQKEAFEKQLADLRLRCEELTTQNSILYQNLEAVTAQATSIKHTTDSLNGSTETDIKILDSETRGLVSSFKKDRDIAVLQLEMSKSEVVRLKSQLDHMSKSLDDARELLASVR